MFTYVHVKWFYGQSEPAYYLNYFIIYYLLHLLHYIIIERSAVSGQRSAVSEHDGSVFCCPLLYITLRGTILVYLNVALSSPSIYNVIQFKGCNFCSTHFFLCKSLSDSMLYHVIFT